MPKYNSDQLTEMAQTFLADHAANGDKSFHLIMVVSMLTGLAPDVILTRIEGLANV